jgi:hypothetical protein
MGKSLKAKVRKGTKLGHQKISAQSERARMSPKMCVHGPFLIKRGISE